MKQLKNLLAKRPKLVTAFAVAGILSFIGAALYLARGHQVLGLANIVGLAFCAFIVITGVKELASKKLPEISSPSSEENP
jgi:hypothetical protein